MTTHTSTQFGWVFAIAGLGLRGDSGYLDVGPIPISTVPPSMQPSPSLFDTPYANVVERDGDGAPLISAQSCGIRPVSGDVQIGTFSLTLRVSEQYPQISRFFFGTRNTRAPIALAANGVDTEPTDLVIWVRAGEGAKFAFADLVYWGREAFRISGVTTGVTYDQIEIENRVPKPGVPDDFVPRNTTSVATQPFGHAATLRTLHSASADGSVPPFKDNRLYLDNPMVEGREVYVYQTDGVTETLYGVYIITGRPRLSADGLTYTIDMQDAIGMMAEREFNAQPNVYTIATVSPTGSDRLCTATMTLSGKTRAEWERDSLWLYSDRKVLQLGSSVVVASTDGADESGAEWSVFLGFPWAPAKSFYGSEPVPMDTSAGGFAQSLVGKKVYELLISDPGVVEGFSPMPAFIRSASEHPYYVEDATWGITGIATHPFTQLLVHMSQLEAPNMPQHWRITLPPNTVDVAEILRLKTEQYAWADRHIGVIAGEDGKPVNCLKWLSATFLRPFCLSFATTAQGKITIRSLVNVESFTELGVARIMEGRGVDLPSDYTRSAWVLKLGQAFKDADAVNTVSISDGIIDELFPYRTERGEMSAPGIMHADETLPADVRTQDPVASLVNIYVTVGQMFRYPLQMLNLNVNGSTRVLPGDWISVTVPGLLNDETGLPYVSGEEQPALCVVLESQPNVAGDMSQEVRALRFPIDPVVIAPSANVATLVSSTQITVATAVYIEPLDGSGEYVVGSRTFTTDAGTFISASRARIMTKSMAAKTLAGKISISGNTITFDSPLTLVGGGAYSFAAGDVLCCTSFDDADANSLETFAYLGHSRYSL